MLIANPIYDIVFKRLMENERVAKFFISTILDININDLEIKPQEFTFKNKKLGFTVLRLDFIATIRTESCEYKKVLIEIQKARNQIDLARFRNYLGEQYKKEDKINGELVSLPITTIYILGFKIPEVKSACIKVERNYKDLITNNIIEEKSDFIEKLTHDCYVVQVPRVTDRFQTKLDRLLSIFEQKNFAGSEKHTKFYNHKIDENDEDLKTTTKILVHTGASQKDREQIEKEEEAWRTVLAYIAERNKSLKEKIEEKDKKIEEKDKKIEEKDKKIEESEKKIEEKDKEIEENKKELEDKNKELEFLKKQLEDILKNKSQT